MKKIVLSLSLAALVSLSAYADNNEIVVLSEKEQQDMLKNSSFEMPSAGALVTALSHNLGDIKWNKYVPLVKLKKYTSNEDRILDLGNRGADAYFLASSKDAKNLIAVSTKINYLLNKIQVNGKSLNSDERKKRLNKIKDMITNNNWDVVLKEINELQNSIDDDFIEAKNPEFKLINEVGGWIEGYRLAVNGFKENYKAEATDILLQNDLIEHLINSVKKSSKLKSFKKRDKILKTLQDIQGVLKGSKNYQLDKSQINTLHNILKDAKSYL